MKRSYDKCMDVIKVVLEPFFIMPELGVSIQINDSIAPSVLLDKSTASLLFSLLN